MPNKTYSHSQKLAGAALGRVLGIEAAAAELKVDKRTIERWLKAAPQDGWTLARDLAQARLQEQLATGKVAPSQLATIAGIADRNVRYGELIKQREAKRSAQADADAPTAEDQREELWHEHVFRANWLASANAGQLPPGQPDSLDYRVSRYLYHTLAQVERDEGFEQHYEVGVDTLLLFARRGEDTRPDAAYIAFLAEVRAKLEAAVEAWWPVYCAAQQANAYAIRAAGGGINLWRDKSRYRGRDSWEVYLPPSCALPPELAGMAVLADTVPEEAEDVTPLPLLTSEAAEAVPAPPRADNGRGWRPYERTPQK